jgi:hypothetical protein
MKNVVCWRKEDARLIINPDVDAQPDAFFRAVHTDIPIRQQDPERNRTTIVTGDDVLTQFLEEPNFALIPVIGNSGSGKSHLIRWLNLRIKRDDTREILFVPKAKTNLRDIVRDLIDRIPETAQEKYLDMLKGTGTGQLNTEAQRSSVLNNLQTELKNDPGDPQAEDKELEKFLVNGLGDLFIDPYVRSEHFLRDNSFAAELAAHVYERPESYNPAEHRREFDVKDLPLEIESLKNAAGNTQEFLQYLLGQTLEIRQKAVDIINRHTDAAIARCLNLSGDHLIQIMTEMRQNLKQAGKELVLLIEDFARLQGLDRALLQSVLDKGNTDICTLRTAFACTIGFYGTLEPTVKTRASFVIDMDNPLGTGRDSFDIYGMVARYMNACRLGPKWLEKSWKDEMGPEASFEIQSSCEVCEHQMVCHAAFGHEDGFGLYPFTREAIDVMARRSDERVDQQFNARQFQKDVLRPVTQLTSELDGGKFPTKALLNDLGGLKNFPLDEQQKVIVQAPDDADRHLALIALWLGETHAVNLDKRIQEAFNLGRLDKSSTEIPDTIEPPPPPLPPDQVNPESDELIRWANEATAMSQQLARALRSKVFEAICSFINWDEIGCPKATWAGSTGLFRQNGVLFVNQSTKPAGGSQVGIEIPLDWGNINNRTSTYLALTGLLESDKAGSWDIPDANKKYVCLQECLQTWADDVTRQMVELKNGLPDWDPAAAALELRVLGVLLSTPQEKIPDKADLVELGLGPFGSQIGYATSEMKSLFALLVGKEDMLSKAIREGTSATKGGQVGNILNSNVLVEAMKAFRARDYTLGDLPDDKELRVPQHKEVFSLAKAVFSQIDGAILKEVERRRQWLDKTEIAFGDETDEAKIYELIRNTVSGITSLGIQGSGEVQTTALTFSQTRYSDVVRSVRSLRKQNKVRPWDMAVNVGNVILTSEELISRTANVLEKAKLKIEATMESQGYDPTATNDLLTQVREDVAEIVTTLEGRVDE